MQIILNRVGTVLASFDTFFFGNSLHKFKAKKCKNVTNFFFVSQQMLFIISMFFVIFFFIKLKRFSLKLKLLVDMKH